MSSRVFHLCHFLIFLFLAIQSSMSLTPSILYSSSPCLNLSPQLSHWLLCLFLTLMSSFVSKSCTSSLSISHCHVFISIFVTPSVILYSSPPCHHLSLISLTPTFLYSSPQCIYLYLHLAQFLISYLLRPYHHLSLHRVDSSLSVFLPTMSLFIFIYLTASFLYYSYPCLHRSFHLSHSFFNSLQTCLDLSHHFDHSSVIYSSPPYHDLPFHLSRTPFSILHHHIAFSISIYVTSCVLYFSPHVFSCLSYLSHHPCFYSSPPYLHLSLHLSGILISLFLTNMSYSAF